MNTSTAVSEIEASMASMFIEPKEAAEVAAAFLLTNAAAALTEASLAFVVAVLA